MNTLLKIVVGLLAVWLAFTVFSAVVGFLFKALFYVVVIGGVLAAGVAAVGWVKSKKELK